MKDCVIRSIIKKNDLVIEMVCGIFKFLRPGHFDGLSLEVVERDPTEDAHPGIDPHQPITSKIDGQRRRTTNL